MQLPSNIFQFECHFDIGTGSHYKSIHGYKIQTKMNSSSMYGTDFEIIAFATMIEANVMVYMCAQDKWSCYEPAFTNDSFSYQ